MSEKRYTYLDYSRNGYIGSFFENDKPLTNKEVVDILKEKDQIISDQKIMLDNIEKEIRILKITYAKCRDCQHANMYTPEFAFLVIDPRCELDVKPINSDTSACEDFELIGRCSR